MHLCPVNGAAHRVGKGDAAWSFPEVNFAEVIVGVDPDPANNPRLTQWAKDITSRPGAAGANKARFSAA